MKRTTLVLDEDALEEATRLAGEKTYSETVNRALRDLSRHIKARDILSFTGSGVWRGDLATLRADTRREG